MNSSSSVSQSFRNSILSSLPEAEMERLRPHLTPEELKLHRTLHDPGEPTNTVYFPEDAVCSIVSTMEDGNSIEVGIVGREGFEGVPAVLGTQSSVSRTVVQLAGTGYSVKAKTLEHLFSSGARQLCRYMNRSIHGLLVQTAQTAACNRVHQIEERLSRWLLMCFDRMESDAVSITHEYLSIMLGTRRSTVTLALGILQSAGFIEHTRGQIKVLNRQGLEGTACECYSVVQREYERLGLL